MSMPVWSQCDSGSCKLLATITMTMPPAASRMQLFQGHQTSFTGFPASR